MHLFGESIATNGELILYQVRTSSVMLKAKMSENQIPQKHVNMKELFKPNTFV